ncbi:MAG: hypothetical protein KTR24_05280 [Saprospiraceae bacterium]|nr:hypothetical protein [Saprospiraceae bacterium]
MKSTKQVWAILLAFVCCYSLTDGQTSSLQCIGQIDKPIYVTGEVIWFDVLLPTFLHGKEFSTRTSIHRQDGKSIDHFFIKSEGKSNIDGYYKIPYALEAGLYRIHLAVRSTQTNQNEALITMTVPIYNDLKSAPQDLRLAKTVVGDQSMDQALQVSIDADAGFAPGESVAAKVKVKDAQGNPVAAQLSVSVTDTELLADLPYTRTTFVGEEIDRFDFQELESAVFVTGTVLHQDRDEPVKLNVFGGYSGTDNRIFYTGTDDDGKFLMKIPDYTGAKPIQFMGYQREEDRIRVVLDETTLPEIEDELAYTEGVLQYMNWSRLRKKIYQYHGGAEFPLALEEIIPEPQKLKPNARYVMDEYESFETVSAFFNELMAALTFILEEDSTYTASMYNPSGRIAKNTYLSGDPLFIIDDKATRDATFVAEMSASPVETMELFLQPVELLKTFSALGISGVVRIKTRLRDIEVPSEDYEDVFPINGLQARSQFPSRNIEGSEDMPQFSSSLFWDSAVESDPRGESTIIYQGTDDRSTFKIRVFARDESGNVGIGEATYRSDN